MYQTRHSGHAKWNPHSLLQRPPQENAPAQPVSIIILEYCMYQAVLHYLGTNKQQPEKFSRSLYWYLTISPFQKRKQFSD